MNKQFKSVDQRGIEWTDYTHNPIGGCQHGCEWDMPDGTSAVCYAKTVAENVARKTYPLGFEHHYYRPSDLADPLSVKTPSRIFLDSMSDLMGAWIPEEQVLAVLDVVKRADWHTFQLLTKNAPRLLKFKDALPKNLWVGVSMPPSRMLGHDLTVDQQQRYLFKAWDTLAQIKTPVRWMSFEPLSFDVRPLLDAWHMQSLEPYPCINWMVIGAASKGNTYFQPKKAWVEGILEWADHFDIPVFMKGNLDWPKTEWCEEFPATIETIAFEQGRLF
jgi:protein gp37